MDDSSFQDKTLNCIDCKTQFSFSAGEQSFYADKDLTPPKRCKDCRAIKKAKQFTKGGGGGKGYGNNQVPGVHEENVPMNGASDFL